MYLFSGGFGQVFIKQFTDVFMHGRALYLSNLWTIKHNILLSTTVVSIHRTMIENFTLNKLGTFIDYVRGAIPFIIQEVGGGGILLFLISPKNEVF